MIVFQAGDALNIEPQDLLKQLLLPRVPCEAELDERIKRAILRSLRHDRPMLGLSWDCFGLFPLDQFAHRLKRGFHTVENARFRDRFQHCVGQLIKLEQIEIRGSKIRALYGHSLRGVIVGEMKWPETTLLHATRERYLDSILQHGLRPQSRTWVHLTSDAKYAEEILKNHAQEGRPVLLNIIPRLLEDNDVTFRTPNSHVWLANHVPPVAIKICKPNDHSEIDF